MNLKGEQRIAASRETVWEALNNEDILRGCIPGCESLEKEGDDGFTATVRAAVGPVKAKFKGQVTLENLDPPNGYTLKGEGKGGAAGFAKGSADVHLAEDGDGTLLTYEVKANVGGQLARIGGRLIDATAKKLSDEFFTKFRETVEGPTQEAEIKPTATPEKPTKAARKGLSPMIWGGILVALVLGFLWYISN
ncbi:MAG: carbon monoxide dehydrogenase subunit G [Sphingomonadales bacterium]|jgi:hypothetical protein